MKTLKLLSLTSVLILSSLLILGGCIRSEDLTAEQRAYRLGKQILCPVCDGQTIDQSNAQIAQDLRSTVRSKVDEGLTDQEVLDFISSSYGQNILTTPAASGIGLVAWGGGGLVLVLGLAVLFVVLRDLKRPLKNQNIPIPQKRNRPSKETLQPYLDEVDEQIKARRKDTS